MKTTILSHGSRIAMAKAKSEKLLSDGRMENERKIYDARRYP
jgi:hypothetical protein